MLDNFAPRLAQVLTEYSIPVHPGNLVLITGSLEAEPLLLAMYEAVVKRGGYPRLEVGLPETREIFLRNAGDSQLDYVDPVTMATMEKIDVVYRIHSEMNTKALANMPPEKMSRAQKAQRPLLDLYSRRMNSGELRWNVTAWPTRALAQEAEMGLLEYSEFVYKACALDRDDPVSYWHELQEKQTKLVKWLVGKKEMKVVGPGVDLRLKIDGRTWVSCHGDNNFPDGEIFTGPVEETVNGRVEFNFPTNYGGRQINGVKLTFKDGVVTEATAAKGEDYLYTQLNLDEGARRLGEFAIGTNWGIQRFTGSTLFDEKIGGTIHMALGRSYPETGGKNISSVHWDMVHNMVEGGEIYVDGELFYKQGQFTIE